MTSKLVDNDTYQVVKGCIRLRIKLPPSFSEGNEVLEEPACKKPKKDDEKDETPLQTPVTLCESEDLKKIQPVKGEKVIGYFERVMYDFLGIPDTDMTLAEFIQKDFQVY